MADRKTAAERAQALVDSAQSKVTRLQKQHDTIAPKAAAVKTALDEAKAELEFAKQHPALAGGAAQPPRTEAEVDEQIADQAPDLVGAVEADVDPEPAEEEPTPESEYVPDPEEAEPVKKDKADLFDQDDPFA